MFDELAASMTAVGWEGVDQVAECYRNDFCQVGWLCSGEWRVEWSGASAGGGCGDGGGGGGSGVVVVFWWGFGVGRWRGGMV
jgi:hypothetical protein